MPRYCASLSSAPLVCGSRTLLPALPRIAASLRCRGIDGLAHRSGSRKLRLQHPAHRLGQLLEVWLERHLREVEPDPGDFGQTLARDLERCGSIDAHDSLLVLQGSQARAPTVSETCPSLTVRRG